MLQGLIDSFDAYYLNFGIYPSGRHVLASNGSMLFSKAYKPVYLSLEVAVT